MPTPDQIAKYPPRVNPRASGLTPDEGGRRLGRTAAVLVGGAGVLTGCGPTTEIQPLAKPTKAAVMPEATAAPAPPGALPEVGAAPEQLTEEAVNVEETVQAEAAQRAAEEAAVAEAQQKEATAQQSAEELGLAGLAEIGLGKWESWRQGQLEAGRDEDELGTPQGFAMTFAMTNREAEAGDAWYMPTLAEADYLGQALTKAGDDWMKVGVEAGALLVMRDEGGVQTDAWDGETGEWVGPMPVMGGEAADYSAEAQAIMAKKSPLTAQEIRLLMQEEQARAAQATEEAKKTKEAEEKPTPTPSPEAPKPPAQEQPAPVETGLPAWAQVDADQMRLMYPGERKSPERETFEGGGTATLPTPMRSKEDPNKIVKSNAPWQYVDAVQVNMSQLGQLKGVYRKIIEEKSQVSFWFLNVPPEELSGILSYYQQHGGIVMISGYKGTIYGIGFPGLTGQQGWSGNE